MNNEKPLLTAVVLTFNNEETIARCLDSLLNQKTSYRYEVRIYDDCSKDGNIEICRRYAEKYPDKVRLTVQPENTFLKAYNKTQSYQAFQEIDTKYFCIIEGDDYWCSENKIQTALDFLENHPEYVGWAHDTLQVDEARGTRLSWVHDIAKYKIENPVTFDDRFIFLMSCSRIFRMTDFKKLKVWPVDYLVYNYHLSKGPVYFHDEIMAVYTIGPNGTFTTMSSDRIADMNGMFAYKISKILNFKYDALCTEMQKKTDTLWGRGDESYKHLKSFKKNFGIKAGWMLWFIRRFVWKYGFESMNVNYVYPRRAIKKNSNKKFERRNEDSFLRERKEVLARMRGGENQKEFQDFLKETVFDLFRKNAEDRLCDLTADYPEAYPFIVGVLSDRNESLLRRCKKYRKQRTLCVAAFLVLLVVNIATFFYFRGA